MTFSEWKALSPEERIRIRKTWKPYEAGYWHALNAEAVEHFKREHDGDPKIVKVLGGTFHGGRLIIGVRKNVRWQEHLPLPEDYYGFDIVQLGD